MPCLFFFIVLESTNSYIALNIYGDKNTSELMINQIIENRNKTGSQNDMQMSKDRQRM